MFNLIMGSSADTRMDADRVFEHTDGDLARFFMAAAPTGRTRLESLPTLVLPELQDLDPASVARVGHIENLSLTPDAAEWRYRFVPNPSVAPIPMSHIRAHTSDLQINRWEGNRTHWAIKPVELYAALRESGAQPPIAPTVFALPTDTPVDPDLLAVMMPFAGYDAVYKTLQAAADSVGMWCVRADDIWEKEHILDDVLSLIWGAGIVVADFTGKNANVFYETGIAHTIGRRLVPITQSMDDVPFDLRSVRALRYLNNAEGRDSLQAELTERLHTIRKASR